MAKFIAISGPSSTGKTSLVNSLSTYPELSGVVFSPDIYETVWNSLVEQGYFSDYSEINTDAEYLCVYILKLIEYYESYMDKYEDTDNLVILDGSWIDLSVYSLLNLWYTRVIKEVQENIFSKINKFDDRISKVYMTSFDESKQIILKNRVPYRIANMKVNRPLELQYYNLFENFKNCIRLPSTDISASSLFIRDDLKNLGYL